MPLSWGKNWRSGNQAGFYHVQFCETSGKDRTDHSQGHCLSPEEDFFTEAIYLADVNGLYQMVRSCDDKVSTLFLVGHNFGITDFAVSLVGEGIDNIPTCGIAAVELDLASWQQAGPNSGRLLFLTGPRDIKGSKRGYSCPCC